MTSTNEVYRESKEDNMPSQKSSNPRFASASKTSKNDVNDLEYKIGIKNQHSNETPDALIVEEQE